MKDLSRHMKHVQKKVIQSERKNESTPIEIPVKNTAEFRENGKLGEALKNRRSGRRRRL